MEIYKNLSLEDLPNEEWRDVVGYEGLFQVSSNGVIRSLDRYLPMPNGGKKIVKGKLIKQYLTRNGYMIVILGKTHNDRKRKYVHRIVAKQFPEICGEWFEECQIDHINCIRQDNRAINLKVCTASENANNPLTLKHQSIKKLGKKMSEGFGKKISSLMKGRKHTECTKEKIRGKISIPILQFALDGRFIREWNSATEVERNLKISHSQITACCKKRKNYKTAGGYKWEYK
jgi:hypothetical protein